MFRVPAVLIAPPAERKMSAEDVPVVEFAVTRQFVRLSVRPAGTSIAPPFDESTLPCVNVTPLIVIGPAADAETWMIRVELPPSIVNVGGVATGPLMVIDCVSTRGVVTVIVPEAVMLIVCGPAEPFA